MRMACVDVFFCVGIMAWMMCKTEPLCGSMLVSWNCPHGPKCRESWLGSTVVLSFKRTDQPQDILLMGCTMQGGLFYTAIWNPKLQWVAADLETFSLGYLTGLMFDPASALELWSWARKPCMQMRNWGMQCRPLAVESQNLETILHAVKLNIL